jgi:hypothetical protein
MLFEQLARTGSASHRVVVLNNSRPKRFPKALILPQISCRSTSEVHEPISSVHLSLQATAGGVKTTPMQLRNVEELQSCDSQ